MQYKFLFQLHLLFSLSVVDTRRTLVFRLVILSLSTVSSLTSTSILLSISQLIVCRVSLRKKDIRVLEIAFFFSH